MSFYKTKNTKYIYTYKMYKGWLERRLTRMKTSQKNEIGIH